MNDRSQWRNVGFTFGEEPGNPRRYEAWEEASDRALRLCIQYAKGRSVTLPYGIIIFVEFIPPALLSIMSVHYTVTLRGRNLGELNALLQEEKIQLIHQFDERRHDRPAETDPQKQTR